MTDKKDFENALEMIDWQNKMLKQQADEIVKLKLEWQYMYDRANMEATNEPVAFVDEIWITRPDLARNIGIENMFMRSAIGVKNYIPLYTHPVKELTDEEWNKAFDFYCETDEGVLRFDLELRDEWKKEQLIRWKEALRKAQE